MPYHLRKAPKRDLYWVVNKETGKKHSKEPLPKERALAQMRALYASEDDMKGGAIPLKTMHTIAWAAYPGRTPLNIDGWRLFFSTPTMKFYNKDKEIIVSVRGTDPSDRRDLAADLDAYNGKLATSERFLRDLNTLNDIQQKNSPREFHYFGTGHSLGGAILDEFLKRGLLQTAMSYNPMIQPQDATNTALRHRRIYHIEDPLYQIFGKNAPNVEVRSGESNMPMWKAYMRNLPYGFGFLFKSLDAHKIGKFQGGSVKTPMETFLEEKGIDPTKYLNAAKQLAKSYDYDPNDLSFSEDGIHKLKMKTPEGGIQRFGRIPYNDYIQYSHQEACGTVEKGTAERMRERYWKSHSKMGGKWKSNDYSANWLSMRVLW